MKKPVIKEIEFEKVKHAYFVVKIFLDKESTIKPNSVRNGLTKDLSNFGDDGYELLEKFVEKFELRHSGFEFNKHFHSEHELFGSGTTLVNLINLSVWIPLKIIEKLSLGKINAGEFDFEPFIDREVKEMTFKDLLTWYIEGEYATSKDIKYVIKTS